MSAVIGGGGAGTAIKPIGTTGDSHSPLLYLHCAISMAGNQWLGDETFRLLAFEGTESVSEPFDYQLQLRGNTSPSDGRTLNFDAVIGRPVSVGVNLPTLHSQPDAARRFAQALSQGSASDMTLYSGIVSSFAMDEPGVYRLGMKPALWKLTLTNRYCVHAQMSMCDVITELMQLHHIDYSLGAVSGKDNPAIARVQDWLQAGESDYEFLRRMMGKAHIFYFFRHTGQGHTVVFANRPAYPEVMGGRALRYTQTALDELGLQQSDLVFQYSYQQSLTSSGVSGAFAHQESASEQDTVATYQAFSSFTPADPGELPFNQYRTYQYGLSSAEVQQYIKNTASSLTGSRQQLSGQSTCTDFRVGSQFSLSGEVAPHVHPAHVRPTLEGRPFVLSKVQHKASADGGYTNSFEATDASAMLTVFSVQDTQQGAIVAKVIDVAGNQPKDWRYYERRNFNQVSNLLRDTEATPPDLLAKGVYVEFSSPGSKPGPVWVKLASHMQTVPEIGVMVLVTRANDESELPEVQSIVQSSGSLVITPSGWTANTHVGSSYSTSYGDGQSIRFGLKSADDLDKAIQIVSSNYDKGEYRETSFSQGASYSYSTSENGMDGLLSRSDSFGSTYSTHEGKEVSSTSTVGGSKNYSTTTGDTLSHENVMGTSTRVSTQNIVDSKSTTNVQSSTNMTGENSSTDTVGSSTTKSAVAISKSQSTTGKSSQTSMTGTHSDCSVTGMSDSISVVGSTQSMSAVGSSESTSATGSSIQNSLTGSSVSTSLTGSTVNSSVTGSSVSTSLTGSSVETHIMGSSARVSVTGVSSSISVTAASMSVEISGPSVVVKQAPESTSIEMAGTAISIPVIYIYL